MNFCFRSGVEAKRGVEFRHSIRKPLEFSRKWGTVVIQGSLYLPCYERNQREADNKKLLCHFFSSTKEIYKKN